MKIKLLTLFITIATLSLIIYQERFMLPSADLTYSASNHNYSQNNSPNNSLNNSIIPDFDFNIFNTNIKNNLYNLKSDKIYIHFWATWCSICTKELKDMILFAKKNPNKTILAISIDDDKTDLSTYLKKIDKKNNLTKINNLLFIWDKNYAISQDLFNTTRVPETYLVNKNHEIINKFVGRANWKAQN